MIDGPMKIMLSANKQPAGGRIEVD